MMVMRISTENDLLKQDIERLQKENEILSLGRGTMNFSSALTKKLQEELAQSEAYKHQLIKENGRYRERIAELESKLHQWISVEDKLPDDNSMVVAACGYEYSEPDAAVCNFYSGRFCLNTDGLDASNYDGGAVITMIFNVTHWMPLPDVIKRR